MSHGDSGEPSDGPQERPGPWDHVAAGLQQLREARGGPSYARIADRVAAQRMDAGADEYAARVSRTTVWEQFRPGRARVNESLVREIAAALHGDPEVVEGWLRGAPSAPPEPSTPTTGVSPAQHHETEERVAPARVLPVPALLLMVACVGLNAGGLVFVSRLDLPFFLDMIGTAVVAIALGPWRGAAVAVGAHVVGVLGIGVAALPFALVNALGALLWGYGVHAWGLGRSPLRFLGLCVGVAAACSALAVPMLLALYGTEPREKQDAITELFFAGASSADQPLAMVAAFLGSNLFISLGDKLICGFVGLVVATALPAALRGSPALFTLPLGAGQSPQRSARP